MQKRSTGGRKLLVTQALFILLQVTLALQYHHQFTSDHSIKDSLHAIPEAFHLNLIHQDALNFFPSAVLLSPSSCFVTRTRECAQAPAAVLVTDPSQSRAPPSVSC